MRRLLAIGVLLAALMQPAAAIGPSRSRWQECHHIHGHELVCRQCWHEHGKDRCDTGRLK